LSVALYAGLVGTVARIHARLTALGEFQMRRRREIEARISALEARPATLADAYDGAWKTGSYKRGRVVTYGGSMFLCMKDTEAQPETSTDWVLSVKRGRDGRNK
jgi:hypothetical protein